MLETYMTRYNARMWRSQKYLTLYISPNIMNDYEEMETGSN